MKRAKRHWFASLSALPTILLCAGCASLRIEVAVYNGPILKAPDARIAESVGLAKSLRDLAEDVARHGTCNKYKSLVCNPRDHAALLKEIVLYHDDTLGIPTLAEQWQQSRIAAGSAADTRAELLSALLSFSSHCQVIVERLALPDLIRGFYREMYLQCFGLFPAPARHDEYIAALVAIEEVAQILNGVAGSVLAEDSPNSTSDENSCSAAAYHSRVHYVMASQKPGLLLTAIKNNPALYAKIGGKRYIKELYEERYWTPINPARTRIVGEGLTVLVKDELGNWHLKTVKSDPSKVVEESTKAMKALVTAAAKFSGL